jgi:hypothetical protein
MLGLVVYRLYFHPLTHIPGPLLARITDWYNVVVAFGDDRHLDFYKLHQKYGMGLPDTWRNEWAEYHLTKTFLPGTVVRYGPSRVSINSNTALPQIYHVKANVQKSNHYSIFSHYFKVPSVLTSITSRDHGPKRRIVSQGLSESAIQATRSVKVKDVFYFLQKGRDPETGAGFTPDALIAEASLLILGGR